VLLDILLLFSQEHYVYYLFVFSALVEVNIPITTMLKFFFGIMNDLIKIKILFFFSNFHEKFNYIHYFYLIQFSLLIF